VPYDSIISRADADSLIPQGQAEAVIKAATQESAALTRFNRAQLSTKVPVMSALSIAYWVAGDTGLKQTSEAWAGVDLVAEEIACIVPIPEAVAQVLDAAAIGGINKPASWPSAIVPPGCANPTSAHGSSRRVDVRGQRRRPDGRSWKAPARDFQDLEIGTFGRAGIASAS